MGRDLDLPDTELTILESIRNLLRAWFIIWLILTLLGTFGLIVLVRRDPDQRMTALDQKDKPQDKANT